MPTRESSGGDVEPTACRFFYAAKASRSERNRGTEGLYWRIDRQAPIGYVQITLGEWEALGQEEERIFQETGKRVSLRARGNIHPTVKCLDLCEYLIRLVSREGAIVLDPFLGSGTTALAAKRLGRHFVGIDCSEEYCQIAERRLASVLL